MKARAIALLTDAVQDGLLVRDRRDTDIKLLMDLPDSAFNQEIQTMRRQLADKVKAHAVTKERISMIEG